MFVVVKNAKVTEWSKCSCCGERLRKESKALVSQKGKVQATFCPTCVKQGYHQKDERFEVVESFDEIFDREKHAERMAEHFAECRMAGVSQETAWDDWDFKQGR